MFWIHGGSYTVGSAIAYPTEALVSNFVKRGVIVVTITYRLGIFGFFSSMNGEIPGNYGLMDQIMALKWVNGEIVNFGGDPDKITIFGESAGAASVSILTLSPLAKGLFSKAILQSGSAFGFWPIRGSDFRNPTKSRDTAVRLNCTTDEKWAAQNFTGMLECLQGVPADVFFHNSYAYFMELLHFKPRIDGNGGVIPECPEKLAEKRLNFPMMIGTNKDEMANFIIGEFAPFPFPMEYFNEEFFNQTMVLLGYNDNIFGENVTKIRNTIFEAYAPTNRSTTDYLEWAAAVIEASSSHQFFAPARKDGFMARRNGNRQVYYYSFDYTSDSIDYPQRWKVAPHVHELFYLFKGTQVVGPSQLNRTFTDDDWKIYELMGVTWTNFAKTGDPMRPTRPEIRWKPASLLNPGRYLSFNVPPLMKKGYGEKAARIFNRDIFQFTNRTLKPCGGHKPAPRRDST